MALPQLSESKDNLALKNKTPLLKCSNCEGKHHICKAGQDLLGVKKTNSGIKSTAYPNY